MNDDGEGKWIVKLGDSGTAQFDFEQFSVLVLPSKTAILGTTAYTAKELLEREKEQTIKSNM